MKLAASIVGSIRADLEAELRAQLNEIFDKKLEIRQDRIADIEEKLADEREKLAAARIEDLGANHELDGRRPLASAFTPLTGRAAEVFEVFGTIRQALDRFVAAGFMGCGDDENTGTGGSGGGTASSSSSSVVSSSASSSSSGGGTSMLGLACTMDSQCGDGGRCLLPSADSPVLGGGAVNGYCTKDCVADTDCQLGRCLLPQGGGSGECFLECQTGPELMFINDPLDPTKCHGREDLRCTPLMAATVATLKALVPGYEPFDQEQDALLIANGVEFGLAGAVWTSDVPRALRVAGRMEAGQIYVNGYYSPAMSESPAVGHKKSGFGEPGYLKYTVPKTVFVRLAT